MADSQSRLVVKRVQDIASQREPDILADQDGACVVHVHQLCVIKLVVFLHYMFLLLVSGLAKEILFSIK